MNLMAFKRGLRDGIAIAIGYFSVSFSFGLTAVASGISWWEAVLISLTNLTSSGQFAGIGIIAASGSYVEMMVTELVINMRYALMSISLSQKLDPTFKRWQQLADQGVTLGSREIAKLTDTVYGAKLNARYGFEAVARREPDEEGQDRFTLMIYKNREAVENDPPLYHFTTPIHR